MAARRATRSRLSADLPDTGDANGAAQPDLDPFCESTQAAQDKTWTNEERLLKGDYRTHRNKEGSG